MLCYKIIFALLVPVIVVSKSIQNRRVIEFDEEELELLRSAYDTPNYDQDSSYDHDSELNKLDLLKDGLWALKVKLKELKAFDKALKANLLVDKLKIAEFLKYHLMDLKKHHHHDYDYGYNKKPTYSGYQGYQAQQNPPAQGPPLYGPPPYGPPQYAPQYNRYDPYYGQ